MLYGMMLSPNGARKDARGGADGNVIFANTPIKGGTHITIEENGMKDFPRQEKRFIELEHAILTKLGPHRYQHEEFIITSKVLVTSPHAMSIRYTEHASNKEVADDFDTFWMLGGQGAIGHAMHIIFFSMDKMLIMIHTK